MNYTVEPLQIETLSNLESMEDSDPAEENQSYISVENLLLLNQLSPIHLFIITQSK